MKLRNQKGQSMTEYVLIIGLVVGVILGGFRLFGPAISGALDTLGKKVLGVATENVAK